jgi:hypothetical protein
MTPNTPRSLHVTPCPLVIWIPVKAMLALRSTSQNGRPGTDSLDQGQRTGKNLLSRMTGESGPHRDFRAGFFVCGDGLVSASSPGAGQRHGAPSFDKLRMRPLAGAVLARGLPFRHAGCVASVSRWLSFPHQIKR